MKKVLICLSAIVLCFMLVGCGKGENSNSNSGTSKQDNDAKELTKEEIAEKLYSINNDLTDLWNEVICEVSWYTSYGTSSIGEPLDIDFVVSHAKEYYDKVIKNKEFVDNLSDEYSNIIDAYDKAVDKATIIYNKIMEEKPVANSTPSYKDDISLFQQYQNYFYEKVTEMYYNN